MTQHIPNKGEHLIRHYGCYSNKARGLSRKEPPPAAAPGGTPTAAPSGADSTAAPWIPSEAERQARRRWAMLIQRVYQVDPLICPHCGGAMKIVAFIEAHQVDVLERILRHCGLWKPPPPRPPPRPPPAAMSPSRRPRPRPGPRPRPVVPQRYAEIPELDPDFLEHLHREAQAEQLNLPWD